MKGEWTTLGQYTRALDFIGKLVQTKDGQKVVNELAAQVGVLLARAHSIDVRGAYREDTAQRLAECIDEEITGGVDPTWVTRGGYRIVVGPIIRPMNCWQYVVLNDDGHFDQLHVCKCFADGRISKRGESQYDLIPRREDSGTTTDP